MPLTLFLLFASLFYLLLFYVDMLKFCDFCKYIKFPPTPLCDFSDKWLTPATLLKLFYPGSKLGLVPTPWLLVNDISYFPETIT